jgi:hypothetical protein
MNLDALMSQYAVHRPAALVPDTTEYARHRADTLELVAPIVTGLSYLPRHRADQN